MRFLTAPKLLVFVLVVLAVLVILGFSRLGALETGEYRLELANKHSALELALNQRFDWGLLNFETSEFLKTNNISLIKINLTEDPTPFVTMEYGPDNKTLPYVGFGMRTDGESLGLDIYVDKGTLGTINKIDDDLTFDANAQVFLAIETLREKQKAGGEISSENLSASINSRFSRAIEQTKKLKGSNSLLFTLRKK